MKNKLIKVGLMCMTLGSIMTYADINDLYLNFSKDGSVTQDTMHIYKKIRAVKGDVIDTKIYNLSADADLYVKIGSEPTTSSKDCKSTNGSTTIDSCSVTLSEDADVYVGVYGYKAAEYDVKATLVDSEPKTIDYNQDVFGITPRLEHRDYKIHAKAGDVLKIRAYGMDADGDLYVNLGSEARRGESYVASSHQSGLVDEEVTIEIENDTDVYIGLYADESCIHTVEHHIKVTRTNASEDVIILNNGEADSGSVALEEWKHFKIHASAGDTVKGILSGLDADADLYMKIGRQAGKHVFDCKSAVGGTVTDSCDVRLTKDTDVYIAIYGYRATNFIIRADVKNGDVYATRGEYIVVEEPYIDDTTMSYYPSNASNTPVILLLAGWQNEIDIDAYRDLLQFIASHGYTAIGVPWNVNIGRIKSILQRHDDDLDLSRIGIIGHSIGGGYSFSYMKSLIEDGYGTNGRFILPMDPMYAFDMYKSDMSQLVNTNLLMMKFNSMETDPRVSLVEYDLFNGVDIEKKNYVVLDKKDHGYCTGDVSDKKDLLLPLGALMAYTFKNDNNAYPYALSGENKENPYSLEKVYSESNYSERCTWSTQQAEDRDYGSDINFCGEPYILNN